jgi:hypothetical protein
MVDMKVVQGWPPNIKAIRAVLPVTRRNIFCYGDIIYYPGGNKLPPELMAHEAVHQEQQGSDPALWWKKFLASPKFRLDQEIPAHQAEYRHMLANAPSRQVRRYVKSKGLKQLAKRLSAPMYGGMITAGEAARRIRA